MTAALHDLARRAEQGTAEQQRELLEEAYEAVKRRLVWYALRRRDFLVLVRDIGTDEAFLAAAMMLVPIDCYLTLRGSLGDCWRAGMQGYSVDAATPALAILAASCRAQASKEAR